MLDPVCVPRMLVPGSAGGIRGFWKGNSGSSLRSQDVIVRALKLDPEFVFSYIEKNHGGNSGSSQRSQDCITGAPGQDPEFVCMCARKLWIQSAFPGSVYNGVLVRSGVSAGVLEVE